MRAEGKAFAQRMWDTWAPSGWYLPDEFEQKLKHKIDSCGPCCSCLVTAILIVLIAIYLLQR